MHHSLRSPGDGTRWHWRASRLFKAFVSVLLLLVGILLGWAALQVYLAALV